MIDLYSLFELSQLKAIEQAINPTLQSIWLMRAREYSVKFHTPLHVVVNELDPIFVLDMLNQDKYSPAEVREDMEGILEELYKIKDPAYESLSAQDTEDLVDAVLNKEIARLNKKKNKTPTQQEITSDVIAAESVKPKSGGMDFSQLEQMESATELPKSGFED